MWSLSSLVFCDFGLELAEGPPAMDEAPRAPRGPLSPRKAASAPGNGAPKDGEGGRGGSPGIQAMQPSVLEDCAATGRRRKSFPRQKCLFITRTHLEIVQKLAV